MSPNDKPENEKDEEKEDAPALDARTRFYLALGVAALVAVLALAAVVQPTADPVLNKVLPLLTLVLGYFFGREARQVSS